MEVLEFQGLAQRAKLDKWVEWASDGRFIPFDYQRKMAERIQAAIHQGGGRIIINVPSRHGKSTLISHWLPVWYLNLWPERSIILASYGQALASHWGRKVRNEFAYNPRLATKLSNDSQAVNAWHTPEDGGMVALGVDGPVMGKGGHLIIVDDPHKDWEEAHSFVVREKTIEWFTSTLFSRQEPGATIVVVQQRLHEEDLSGFLIEKHPDPWEVIRLPAIAEAGDVMGRRPGEPLCPSRYSATELDNIKRGMDAAAWEAMFQQNPKGFGPGKLYHSFNQADHVRKDVKLRDDLPLQLDFDFNRNPGMHIEIGQYDPRADLFTVRHEVHGPYLKLEPALKRVEELILAQGGWRWPAMEIFGDATSTQERAETTETAYQIVQRWATHALQNVFKRPVPARIRIPAANPPVSERISTFNTALRDADGDIHFVVHPDCLRLIADLKEMKEDEQGLEDKRDTKLSHASSATGYRIFQLRPVRHRGNQMPPDIGSYKRKF